METSDLQVILNFVLIAHLFAFAIFACIYFSIVDYKTKQLKLQFLSKLNLEERKLIDKYNSTNYFNYRRQLKRIKKNFNTTKDE